MRLSGESVDASAGVTGRGLLRAAVVGTGFVGPHHVDAVRRTGYADVKVIVGSDPTRTALRAAQLGVNHWTTDFEAVCGDPQIDVIHVCTPNESHVALARAVLEARKHLVLEKPIALDLAGASDLVRLAARSNKHAMTVLTYRGYPMVRQARDLVAAGELGQPRLVRGGYVQDWLADPSAYNWRIDPAVGGPSRAVADIGTHWFDTVEFISGLRVSSVLADFATFIPIRMRPREHLAAFATSSGPAEPLDVHSEDAATILLRFAGGARAACVISQISTGRKNAFTVEIDGSDRSLAWDQELPERLWLRGRLEARMLVRDPGSSHSNAGIPSLPAGHPEGWGDALRDLLRPFYAAVAAGDPNASDVHAYPTLKDGARSIAFVEAALASSRAQAWTPISDVV